MSVTEQLTENTTAFIEEVDQVPEPVWATRPSPGVWSVAEVVEHVYRSEFGIPRLFTGAVRLDEDREPDALLPDMEARLNNFIKKRQAPAITRPTDEPKLQSELTQKFGKNREQIAELAKKRSLHEVCLGFEHPIFGYLSRSEWLHFIILHAQRHIHQIKQIKQQVKS